MTEETERGKYHVVLLDDEETTSKLVALALRKRLDCRVTHVDSLEKVDQLSDADSPDLFILDFFVEHKESLEICRQLHQQNPTQEIPIMFFSEHGEPKLRAAAIRAGGVDYLEKPFFPEELVARVQSHVELHRSRQQILAQLNEQQALMRVLCHDLYNPVAAVDSVLRLMKPGDGNQGELLDLARQANESALQLIDHVRAYRGLSDTEFLFDRETFDLGQAVDESLTIVDSMANKKGIRFEKNIEEGLSIHINRIVLVHNILNNLLTNAIKFSFEESVVRIKAWAEGTEEERFCCVQIEDEGIGIPVDIMPDIFSPTHCYSRNGTNDEKGTGFGMPLVKLYVEKCEGSIAVESHTQEESNAPWIGTRILMRFPAKSARPESKATHLAG